MRPSGRRASDLRSRMKFPMHALQVLIVHMGVDLCRGNVCVTEEFLDDTQVGAVGQEMGGKGVAQQMRVDIDFKTGF